MALPFLDRAQITPSKIRDYLLNPEHPLGRAKARFVGGLGFTRDRWAELHAAFVAHAALGDARALLPTAFGQKYLVRGTIEGPTGLRGSVVAVWIIADPATGPRFITAYAEDAK